jgi:ParB family chromosome partitioning protein
LEEPKYSIEQISARTGKSPAYVAARLKLTELAPVVVEAFYREEIGVGHALLLAKLQPGQQEQALAACFREDWSTGKQKAKGILLPVRNLQFWIEQNILLILKDAPFDKRDAQLVPAAGSCVDCPKRTGHNKLLFAEVSRQDACSDPNCYGAKVSAHVAKTIAAKPKKSAPPTASSRRADPGAISTSRFPRKKRREFKTCKYTTEAIVAEGTEKGELRKVCASPDCPVHHPKKQQTKTDAASKAEQEKSASGSDCQHDGIRTLAAIAAAVPVRLMKRDLLFVVERLALPCWTKTSTRGVARQRGIKKAKDATRLGSCLPPTCADPMKVTLGRVCWWRVTILIAASRQNAAQVLRDAATLQGGRRRYRPQGQTGVCSQGKNTGGKKDGCKNEAQARKEGEGRLTSSVSVSGACFRTGSFFRPSSRPCALPLLGKRRHFRPPDGLVTQ